MPAWEVDQAWNDQSKKKYKNRVPAIARRLHSTRARFTCEDLALEVLIRFASYYRLPIRIVTGVGAFDPRDASWVNRTDFRNEVLRRTGARDFLHSDNTVSVSGDRGSLTLLSQAEVGDIIHLQYSDAGHIQLVVARQSDQLRIIQGNFDNWNRTSADPTSSYYIGAILAESTYNLADGTYHRLQGGSRSDDRQPFASHQGQIRRWNFLAWNERATVDHVQVDHWGTHW
jgi:hypothetical protein